MNEKPNQGARERKKVGNLGCFKSYEIIFVIIFFSFSPFFFFSVLFCANNTATNELLQSRYFH